jgi:hypothetical protein
MEGAAERAEGWAIAWWTVLVVLLVLSWSSSEAQSNAGAQWVVGGGVGAVIRTVHRGSLGWNLQASRVLQPARAFYVEPGIILQRYGRSSPSNGLCPPEECPPPLENALSIVGPEVRVAYREPESNPVYPVAGVGVYRVSSQDTSGVRFGTSLGLAVSLRRSGLGPALDFRWLGIFGDSRFHNVFPIALRWSF